ncbi:MAG: PBS lyase [Bacillota bacterium]|nr:PBS lyase [Bacillota bacterium]
MKHLPVVKDVSEEAACPFCGLPVDRPIEVDDGVPRDMPAGRCAGCGAVYACDVTGHNLGAAFVEALTLGCDMDWDLAWDLQPDEDYIQRIVEGYDLATHRIFPEKVLEGRTVRGALCFVRLQRDIQEIKGEGVRKRLAGGGRAASPERAALDLEPDAGEPAKRLSKGEVERLIREYRLGPIVASARSDKKTGRYLQRLLYGDDELLRLRAAEALGRVVKAVAPVDPTTAVAILQGLFTPFETSSASYWGSIDAIGEIIAAAPDLFVRYMPRILPFLEDDALRPAVLRALCRIAETRPDFMRRLARRVAPFLENPDPETRGNAVRFFACLGTDGVDERLRDLLHDDETVLAYEDGELRPKRIGDLAASALAGQ